MKSLDDARSWYQTTRKLVRMIHRIGDKYWDQMPWDGDMGRDESFKTLEGVDITREARSVLDEFDDLAVFVIFSVFEANLRDFALRDMAPQASGITHQALRYAVDKAILNVEEGSLYNNVLRPWGTQHAGITEMVNQIRKYPNWVAHGRRPDKKPDAAVEPVAALQRLQQFLDTIGYAPSPESPGISPPLSTQAEGGTILPL